MFGQQESAETLRARLARFEKGFKRKFPLLVDFVTGDRPIEECRTPYFREQIRAHMRIRSTLMRQAHILEAGGRESE